MYASLHPRALFHQDMSTPLLPPSSPGIVQVGHTTDIQVHNSEAQKHSTTVSLAMVKAYPAESAIFLLAVIAANCFLAAVIQCSSLNTRHSLYGMIFLFLYSSDSALVDYQVGYVQGCFNCFHILSLESCISSQSRSQAPTQQFSVRTVKRGMLGVYASGSTAVNLLFVSDIFFGDGLSYSYNL